MQRTRSFRESTDTSSETLTGGERVVLSGTLHMVDGHEARIDLPGVIVSGYHAGTYKIRLDGPSGEVVHAPRAAFSVVVTEHDRRVAEQQQDDTDDSDDTPSDLERVVEYLERMDAEGRLNNFTESLLSQYRDRGSLSDRQVAAAMKDVEKAARPAPAREERNDTPAVTEPGVYEKDGIVYVVKFNKEKTNLYAKQIRELNSTRVTEAGTVVEIEFDYAPGAIYKLSPSDKMPLERAKEYTIRYGRCMVCGRFLKKAESVERGIGPVCIKSFGG